MVPMSTPENPFLPRQPVRLYQPSEPPAIDHPIQSIEIDWERLIAKRSTLIKTINDMPMYLLKPEVLSLLQAEKNLTYRLILDLMWTTGARISEVLLLTPESFINDGYDCGALLTNLKHHCGRPSKAEQAQHPKRYVPIHDPLLIDEIACYIAAEHIHSKQHLFPMVRQTVNRHIHSLVVQVGGAPMAISSHTFRHSFAIHLILHGRSLKQVSELLGHKSIESTEIYTNVLTIDLVHFLQGVDFH